MDDVFIGGLPYLPKSYKDKLLEKIQDLDERASNFKRRVLVLHQGVDKYLPYEHELEIGELPRGFNYYALGHVHSRVEEDFGEGILCYAGSTEIWRSEEAVDWELKGKGFLVTDLESLKPRRVNLESTRPFISKHITSEDDIVELKARLDGLLKPVLSVVLESGDDSPYLLDKIKEELSNNILHLAVRKKRLPIEETFTRGGVIDLKELLFDALKDVDDAEKAFAFDVYTALSRGDVENALEFSEDFYEKWKRGR